MIRDLLDANRIRAGERLQMKLGRFDLVRLVRLVRRTLAELAAIHGDRFVLRAETSVRGTWGKHEIRRLVENLVTNGVKYGDPRRPITVSVVAGGTASKPEAILEVHNFGDPVPEDEQPTLFHQFRRSVAADGGAQRGWGLGLTLVRGIVQAHGGEIGVVSDEASGTTFRVTLPLCVQANLT